MRDANSLKLITPAETCSEATFFVNFVNFVNFLSELSNVDTIIILENNEGGNALAPCLAPFLSVIGLLQWGKRTPCSP